MSSKYTVFLIAYKNLDKNVEKILINNSVRTINTINDFHQSGEFHSKGLNLNDRLSIYMDWFETKAKEKIKDGYEVAILEVPRSVGKTKQDLLSTLDIGFEKDILVLETVEV